MTAEPILTRALLCSASVSYPRKEKLSSWRYSSFPSIPYNYHASAVSVTESLIHCIQEGKTSSPNDFANGPRFQNL